MDFGGETDAVVRVGQAISPGVGMARRGNGQEAVMHFGGFMQAFPGVARPVSGGSSMIDLMTSSLRSRAGRRGKIHDGL